jgi:hypothetical protein
MGSFAGHAISGTLFLVYGTAWTILSIWNHLCWNSQEQEKRARRSTSSPVDEAVLHRRSWLPFHMCPNWPLEPILKIILPSLGIFMEAFLDYSDDSNEQVVWRVFKFFEEDGEVRDQGKFHHITMECGFVLSGIVDILVLFLRFPPPTSKLFLSLAFSVECILFYLHIEGRNQLNIQIHSILVFVIFCCLLFSILRLASSTNFVINLGLGSCIVLQGTWLIQAGYFLFGGFLERHGAGSSHHDGSHDGHGLLMFFAEVFAWHVFSIAAGNLVLWVLLSLLTKRGILRSRDVVSGQLDLECRDLITCKDDQVFEL